MTIPTRSASGVPVLLAMAFGDRQGAQINDAPLQYADQRVLDERVQHQGGKILECKSNRLLVRFIGGDRALQCAQDLRNICLNWRDSTPLRAGLVCRLLLARANPEPAGSKSTEAVRDELYWTQLRAPFNSITATADFMETLSQPLLPQPRLLGRDKGGRTPLFVLVAEGEMADEGETRAASMLETAGVGLYSQLMLRVEGEARTVLQTQCPLSIGRGKECGLVMRAENVSRVHGRIEFDNGKFYYADDSRNGSYILSHVDAEFHLTGERYPLIGDGVISLGMPVQRQQPGGLVRYHCNPIRLGLVKDPGDTDQGTREPTTQPTDRLPRGR